MAIQEDLKSGILEFRQSAEEEEKKGRKRSAATLYFKAVATVCDYLIYLKFRKIPDNHTERFRTLERHFHDLYKTLDTVFPIYQQTYRSDITAEQLDVMKNAFGRIKEFADSFEKGL
jgi:hypothetical protein